MLKQNTGQAPSMVKNLLGALAPAVLWTIAASLAVAWMLDRELLRMEQTGYGAMIILLVCGMILARKAGGVSGKLGLIRGFTAVLIYYLGLLLINWMFFGGNFSGFGVTAVVLLAGAAIGNFTAGNTGGRRARTRYKIPRG